MKLVVSQYNTETKYAIGMFVKINHPDFPGIYKIVGDGNSVANKLYLFNIAGHMIMSSPERVRDRNNITESEMKMLTGGYNFTLLTKENCGEISIEL